MEDKAGKKRADDGRGADEGDFMADDLCVLTSGVRCRLSCPLRPNEISPPPPLLLPLLLLLTMEDAALTFDLPPAIPPAQTFKRNLHFKRFQTLSPSFDAFKNDFSRFLHFLFVELNSLNKVHFLKF